MKTITIKDLNKKPDYFGFVINYKTEKNNQLDFCVSAKINPVELNGSYDEVRIHIVKEGKTYQRIISGADAKQKAVEYINARI